MALHKGRRKHKHRSTHKSAETGRKGADVFSCVCACVWPRSAIDALLLFFSTKKKAMACCCYCCMSSGGRVSGFMCFSFFNVAVHRQRWAFQRVEGHRERESANGWKRVFATRTQRANRRSTRRIEAVNEYCKKESTQSFYLFFFLMCEAAKKGNTANIHCDAAVSYIKKRQARGA
jgi:hypothetical protein